MRKQLLAWQWSLYPSAHADRRNLLIHALTVPFFLAGTLGVLSAWRSPWLALGGVAAMAGAMALQGRGHAREGVAPVPFAGPADALTRIFAEQWITFPRFVLGGGFARAWRAAETAKP
ncbi:MAG TPA: terminase [Myxococcales bacterium]|nr:terminase [Myxococcales bacterium]